MLVVTTTVRMIDRVHSNTTSLGPGVALDRKLVLCSRSLEHWLVCTAATSNNANHTTSRAENDLLSTGRQLDASLALVGVVANDGDIVARCSAERTTVSSLLFNVGDNGTFRDGTKRQDVADCQVRILAGVDELASVHALVGNEDLISVLELVWASEADLRERSATAGVVDDFLDYTANVAMSFGEVELSELCRSLVQAGVGREDGAAALTLIPDDSTHCAIEPNKNSRSCGKVGVG